MQQAPMQHWKCASSFPFFVPNFCNCCELHHFCCLIEQRGSVQSGYYLNKNGMDPIRYIIGHITDIFFLIFKKRVLRKFLFSDQSHIFVIYPIFFYLKQLIIGRITHEITVICPHFVVIVYLNHYWYTKINLASLS